VTPTVTAECGGVVAVIVFAFKTTTLVAAAPPKVTPAPATKFVPVSVMDVPPTVGPVALLIEIRVGAGDGEA
jgi:hypothetical protein